MQLAVDVETGADRAEADLVAEPDLVHHCQQVPVGPRDHVVEAVDVVAAEVHGAGETFERSAGLEQGHGGAPLRQPQGEAGTEDAAADDPNAWWQMAAHIE